MKCGAKTDRIFPVKGGYVLCPKCLESGLRNKLQEAPPDMKAIRLRLYFHPLIVINCTMV